MPIETQIIQQAYKFRLAPTEAQASAFASHAGAARFIFNHGIAEIASWHDTGTTKLPHPSGRNPGTPWPWHPRLCVTWTEWAGSERSNKQGADICQRCSQELHPAPGGWASRRVTRTSDGDQVTESLTCRDGEPHAHGYGLRWSADIFTGTAQAALRDAAMAWQNFHDSRRGARKGRRMGRPKFKKKGRARDSFQVHGDGLQVVHADAIHATEAARAVRAGRHHRGRPAGVHSASWCVKIPKIGAVRLHEPARKLARRLRRGDVPCPPCGQTGLIPAAAASKARTATTCSSCRGEGSTCSRCGGSGMLRQCEACKGERRCPAARIVRGTVSRDSAGHWHIALTVEIAREIRTGPSARQRAGGVTGIDLGVRDTVTLADGTRYENPAHLEAHLRRLAAAQRVVSRRTRHGQPSSRRRDRAVAKVGRIHRRVASLRLDHIEQLSTLLVHSYQGIGVEGWNVQQTAERGSEGLPGNVRQARNRHLAGAAPGMLRWKLEHKAAWYGSHAEAMGAYAESSRTCSRCGTVKDTPVPPAHEKFACGSCGWVGDRRQNSAVVAARWMRSRMDAPSGGESLNARGAGVSPAGAREGDSRQPAAKREARPSRHDRGEPGTPSG